MVTELQNAQNLLTARTREMSALKRAVSVFDATLHPGQELCRQLTNKTAARLDVEICVILLYNTEQAALLAQTSAVGLDDALIPSYVGVRLDVAQALARLGKGGAVGGGDHR